MFIRVQNTQAGAAPKSNLSSAVQGSATSLPVKNINDFQANYYVQIGQTGEEQSEIVQVAGTPETNSIPSGTTRFPHPMDTPVYAIKYDKILIKRSITGTAGTAVTFGTATITPDQEFTVIEDRAAQPTYAYKAAYYNSALDVLSLDSNWIMPSGYSPYSKAGIRSATRKRLKNIPGIEDDDIDTWTNEYMEMMRSAALQVNEDYGLGTLNVSVGAGTQEYAISDDLHRSPARVWMITGSGTTAYRPIFMSQIDPNVDYSWLPRFYLPGDNSIGFLPPPPSAGTAQIIQNTLDERLTFDTDEIPRPMKPYVSGFIDYNTSMAYRQDGKDALADSREKLALAKIDRFKSEIDPRQTMQAEQVQVIEAVDYLNDSTYWGW